MWRRKVYRWLPEAGAKEREMGTTANGTGLFGGVSVRVFFVGGGG